MFYLACIFTVITSLILPIFAAVYFSIKYEKTWQAVLAGCLTFIVFQLCIRIPVIQVVLPKTAWYTLISVTNPIFYALFLGVTAGLAEELGRYIVMQLFMKKNRNFVSAIAFGIGHGGIEAILLVGINGLLSLFISTTGVTAGYVLASGVERIFAMAIHIACSIIVMKGIILKKIRWLMLAFFLHSIVDAIVVFATLQGISIFTIEVCLAIFTAGVVIYISREYRNYKKGVY